MQRCGGHPQQEPPVLWPPLHAPVQRLTSGHTPGSVSINTECELPFAGGLIPSRTGFCPPANLSNLSSPGDHEYTLLAKFRLCEPFLTCHFTAEKGRSVSWLRTTLPTQPRWRDEAGRPGAAGALTPAHTSRKIPLTHPGHAGGASILKTSKNGGASTLLTLILLFQKARSYKDLTSAFWETGSKRSLETRVPVSAPAPTMCTLFNLFVSQPLICDMVGLA